MMKIFVVFLTVVAMTLASPEYHTFESRYGVDVVVENRVELDKDEEYLIAEIVPVSGNITHTINLHDFAVGYTAIKDDSRDTCYIMEVSHNMQEMMDSFRRSVETNGYFDVKQTFFCVNKRFVPQSEAQNYGERIAKFCKGDELVYSEKKIVERKRRSIKMMSGTALGCGICVGFC